VIFCVRNIFVLNRNTLLFRCDATAEYRYSGKYCEKCPRCVDRCAEFRDCVECKVFKGGPLAAKEACASNCSQIHTIAADDISNIFTNDESRFCSFYDTKECRFRFVYNENYDAGNLVIYAEKVKFSIDCKRKLFILFFSYRNQSAKQKFHIERY
jgi:integrin beta 1